MGFGEGAYSFVKLSDITFLVVNPMENMFIEEYKNCDNVCMIGEALAEWF